MRKSLLAFFMVLILGFASACAQIPRVSEVKAGPALDPQNANEPIYYSPSGPYSGQSQQQVVAGFITAGTAPQNDYATAREFLTKEFKGQWSPSDEVLVQQGGLSFNLVDSTTVTVTLQVAASVDSDGHLTNYPQPKNRVLTYKLSQQSMQWRVDSGPNLTILNRPVFDVLFSGYSLYFFDTTKEYLVPELRWFPARASTATRLVNALIDGPSPWLRAAVEPTLPGNVELAIQAVTIQDGVALINLDAKANSLTNEELRLFKTQSQATLSQLPTVTEVAISLDGLPRTLTSVAYKQPLGTGTTPITLVGDQLTFMAGSAIQGSQSLIRLTDATDFALSLDSRELVMLSTGGLQWAKLGQIDRDLATLDYRFSLLSPTFDRTGRVWSFGKLYGAEIKTVSRGGSAVVKADWLENYERLSYSISDEGSRIAIVVTNRFETKILVAAILRDASGIPVELSQPFEFKPISQKPYRVSWFGENDLIIATQGNDDTVSFFKATLGGSTEGFSTVQGATEVFTSTLGNSVYAVTKSGDLYENQGFGFKYVTSGVTAAHLPH